ncbi:Uncharacterised protein [Amycolatopsis camponoti]|uniref:Uncharacterized protein n=1 Tax=Amycolatopsis camponoti TaxID=2606593 RepID=A0A6I8LQN4_9PSEU|nr:Uncharacterised protein [Amycolatopsis camponoti]
MNKPFELRVDGAGNCANPAPNRSIPRQPADCPTTSHRLEHLRCRAHRDRQYRQ